MKKKLLLAICLMASLAGYGQAPAAWTTYAESVVFDKDAKTMTITGLQAGHLGDIIVTDYNDGSEVINLRERTDENDYDSAPIQKLIVSGELYGADIRIIADMARGWIRWNNDYSEFIKVLKGGLKTIDISSAKIVKDATNPANNIYLDLSDNFLHGVSFGKFNTYNGGNLNACTSNYDLLEHGDGGVYSVENDNEIGDAMFVGCDMLETLILPKTTTLIGNVAFMRFMRLEEMTIPANVEKIESYAFWQAFNMDTAREGVPTTIITFEGDENKVELEENALTQFYSAMGYFAGVESSISQLGNYALDPVIEDNYKAGFVKGVATPPNKYWTFSSGVDVFIPDNVKVYTCQIVNGEADINEITDDLIVDEKRVIKRNNGVLVACPDNAESNAYELVAKYNADLVGTTPATDNANDYPNNSLVPVIKKAHYNPGDYYMLYHGKWVVLASDAEQVPAGKALLKK